MPTPNCEELSNSASAKPSYFFLFFLLFIFFFLFSSCYFFLSLFSFLFFLFSFFLLTRIPNLRYLTFEKHQKRPRKRIKRERLEVPFHTEARTNHPAGIAAEVVADLYLATYAEVLAAEVLAYVVPELWLCGEDSVLSSGFGHEIAVIVLDEVAVIVFEEFFHVSVLVKHTYVILPPEISETAKVQSL